MEFVDKMGTYRKSTNVPHDMNVSPVLGKVLQRCKTAPRLLQQLFFEINAPEDALREDYCLCCFAAACQIGCKLSARIEMC